MGIEPTTSAWKAEVLPLNYTRMVGVAGFEPATPCSRAFIENWHKTTPADILRWYKAGTLAAELGCTQEAINEACPDAAALIADLERWWKLFAGFAVAKRIQAPPVLSLTKRAFGYDHREAQLTPYFSREYYELKEELLK